MPKRLKERVATYLPALPAGRAAKARRTPKGKRTPVVVIRGKYREGMPHPLTGYDDRADGVMYDYVLNGEPHVTAFSNVMGGKPCIARTRYPIDWLMGYLSVPEHSLDEWLVHHPECTREQLLAAIKYAIVKMGYPEPLAPWKRRSSKREQQARRRLRAFVGRLE